MLGQLDALREAVLYPHVDREALVRRLAGRCIRRRCDKSYHETSAALRQRGCEASGTRRAGRSLYQRDDARPESVENRLRMGARRHYQYTVAITIDGPARILTRTPVRAS